jgi:hypothetical protein
MVGYAMDGFQFIDPSCPESGKTVPGGFFEEAELTGFSLLIRNRRSLPLYFGDCWRCSLCTYTCFDFFDMVDHILQNHGPEPFNEADVAELEQEWGSR